MRTICAILEDHILYAQNNNMSLNTIFKNIKKKYLSSTHLLRTYSLPFLLACSGSAQSFTSQENGQNDTQHDAGSPLSETCADADKDDFYASKKCGTPVDCNDYNSAAYPGAREYCDGLDNNCNGTIDEKPPKLLYADRDGDGFGNPEEKVQSCLPPQDPKKKDVPYVSNGDDCDDGNSLTNPDAEDICDYTDNDCDGIADNLFPDAGSECYEGIGECRRSGKYECSADGRELLCPATPGMSLEEICNGLDDDCDGETDEELEAETRICYAGQGECRRSGLEYRVCEGKAGWSIDYRNCDAPAVPAGEERCDEIDHDCDGNNHNGFNVGEDCTRGEGECLARGEYACTADGRGTFCDAEIIAADEERCDGLDNDCDGEVDEDCCAGAETIVFRSNASGNYEIYTMELSDPATLTNISNHPAYDEKPAWSPDKCRIAFVSYRDGNQDIYRMNFDGSDVVRLTNDPAAGDRPAWGPDGRRIAFHSTRSGTAQIYLMNADGSDQEQVTDAASGCLDPTWSPGGERIACYRAAGSGIEAVALADGSMESLTESGFLPNWSPDGESIAYIVGTTLHRVDVSTRAVTNLGRTGYSPTWMPDSSALLYTTESSGADIFLLDLETMDSTTVYAGPGEDHEPDI